MPVFTVSITDGTTLANLAVAAGRGPKGDGFTGGSFNASTGVVTFTSNDGIGFATGDLRGNLSEPSPIGDVTPNTGAFTSLSTTGNTVIGGNLTVNGTTTTVNSQTLDVADKNITIAFGAANAAAADGAGLTVDGANATLTYVAGGDKWAFNKPLDVTGNIVLTGTVDGRDVAADGSKLDGIETGADVTDTANVTAAGALMDSEVTNLAAVKTFDPADYATSAQGSLADTALQDGDTVSSLTITSADINGGTIDGTVIGGSVPAEITASQYNSTEALPDIKPSLNLDFANTKKLDPRITFTRGSTAAYYDGVTFAKAEENLLIRSQEFDNAVWTKDRVTVTANTETAPDGTTTADSVVENTTSGFHSIDATSPVQTGITYTVSVFAKIASGTRNLGFRGFGKGGIGQHPIFDLTTGAVTQNGTDWTNQSIVDVGNGWYRCSASVTSSSTLGALFPLLEGINQIYIGDGTSGLYLWGAQLEQRDALTDYTPTTTQPITNYIPALQAAASGEARFDHDPITGESKGLLIEEQRTNLLLRSEEFDNAGWSKVNATVTSNIVVAPDGTLTGDKLECTSTGSFTGRVTISPSAGQVASISVYAKKGQTDWLHITLSGTNNLARRCWFDLDNGIIGGTAGASGGGTLLLHNMEDAGNGWYRCVVAANAGAETWSAGSTFFQAANNDISSDATAGNSIYLWGAQLEAGAFPTSYIPTVASQVTRSADAASMTGTNFSSWYRQDEGTVFVESQTKIPEGGLGVSFSLNDGFAASRITLFQPHPSAGSLLLASVGGTTQCTFSETYSDGFKSLAAAISRNDFAASWDGQAAQTDSSGTLPVVNQLGIGCRPSGTQLNGHIKKLAYYPKRLSDQTLQALTEE